MKNNCYSNFSLSYKVQMLRCLGQIYSKEEGPVTGKTASQAKKDHKTVSRRDFLKYTGTIVLVMGSGCYAPVNRRSKEFKAPVTSRSGIPASDGYLLFS
jgi:hypothetical protein